MLVVQAEFCSPNVVEDQRSGGTSSASLLTAEHPALEEFRWQQDLGSAVFFSRYSNGLKSVVFMLSNA